MGRRNFDKRTDEDQVILNILRMLIDGGHTDCSNTVQKATLGYAGFPGYSFKWPQGAAFSVAKIARKMEDDKLIHYYSSFGDATFRSGFYITFKGKKYLEERSC
jgi:hypothetical protein